MEEIVKEIGREAAVGDHQGYEDVVVVGTTRKMWKKVMENTLVVLVEEDLVVAHECQTDLEGKDLVAGEVVGVGAVGVDSAEDNAAQLPSPKHGKKVLIIPP